MSDTMTPEQRHRCMSHIRGKDTKPELIVRRWLWREGYRYRLHVNHFPGKPDIVLRRLKTVIFVNGCFWHGHNVQVAGTEPGAQGVWELTDSECCRIPQSNRDFWLQKITRNRLRDYANYAACREQGWHVLVVWECMLRPAQRELTLQALSYRLNDIYLQSLPRPYIQQEEPLPLAAEEQAPYGFHT